MVEHCSDVLQCCRYNCNRYDEEEARRALDAQEVHLCLFTCVIFTQCRSVAKSVGYFQCRLSVCLFVCLWVCLSTR